MDYLVYGYLQVGQDKKARQVLDELKTIDKLDGYVLAAAYSFAAAPARYAVERGRWSDAAKLELYPASFPWNRFPHAEAITYFARALGSARSGDPAAAGKDVLRLEALRQTLIASKDPYWPMQVEIQKKSAEAWIAKAESRNEEAVKILRSAAELKTRPTNTRLPRCTFLPANCFGDLLLELRPAGAKEAEARFRPHPTGLRDYCRAKRAASAG
jgi:hypothetical protein